MNKKIFALSTLVALAASSCSKKSDPTKADDWASSSNVEGQLSGTKVSFLYGRVTPIEGRLSFDLWKAGNLPCDKSPPIDEVLSFQIPTGADGKLVIGRYGIKGSYGNHSFFPDVASVEILSADLSDAAKGVKGKLHLDKGNDKLDGEFTFKLCKGNEWWDAPRAVPEYEWKDTPLAGTVDGAPWTARFANAYKKDGITFVLFHDTDVACDASPPDGPKLQVDELMWGGKAKNEGPQPVHLQMKELLGARASGTGWIKFESNDLSADTVTFSLVGGGINAKAKEGEKSRSSYTVAGKFTAKLCK